MKLIELLKEDEIPNEDEKRILYNSAKKIYNLLKVGELKDLSSYGNGSITKYELPDEFYIHVDNEKKWWQDVDSLKARIRVNQKLIKLYHKNRAGEWELKKWVSSYETVDAFVRIKELFENFNIYLSGL